MSLCLFTVALWGRQLSKLVVVDNDWKEKAKWVKKTNFLIECHRVLKFLNALFVVEKTSLLSVPPFVCPLA